MLFESLLHTYEACIPPNPFTAIGEDPGNEVLAVLSQYKYRS